MPASGNTGPRQPPSNPLDRENFQEASRRAAAEPHKFHAAERATYIRSMVERTKALLREGRSVEEIKQLLPEFVEYYQYLFEMITDPAGYDERNLQVMLSMLEHMHKGSLSQHDASVIVGKRLYEKYGRRDGPPPSS